VTRAPKPQATSARKTSAPSAPTELKISLLARESGVPVATIKHYAREGLVSPARTGRNIAYYAPSAVERVRRIKELQRTRFLPLKVIKSLLDGDAPPGSLTSVEASITKAVDLPGEARTREELLLAGVHAEDLDWLIGAGALRPRPSARGDVFGHDDLELLRTLAAGRRAGLAPEMLPLEIVGAYVEALRNLVTVELTMFREGVLPRAEGDVTKLAIAATELSEKLVVLLRRKLIVPTLRKLAKEAAEARGAHKPPRPKRPVRAALTPNHKSRK